MKDMDVLDFARKISMLSTNTPLSIEYDKAHGQKTGDIWWTCQREHLTVWCLHYPTGGTKEFKHKPSNSSKTMYNLFGRPETLLWLTEALGEKKEIIQEIIDEIKDIKRQNSCCKIIREKIPYERILELLAEHES